ncbi:MAG: VWA domain-containing protein [Pyrinomonadaceae bacterium]|nr:VWA domain-containing protein [Pyrinomonadaceae bacterium]
MYQPRSAEAAIPGKRIAERPSQVFLTCTAGLILLLGLSGAVMAQAGRRQPTSNEGGVLVSIVAQRADSSRAPITAKQLAVYDNGIEQTIRNLTPDPSPARIVLLVDNSLTIRADVEKLERATREFAYEIFEGDKLLIVGYDEQAEIVSDWTDDAKSIESSLKLFRKKGQPHLFDAATAVIDQALKATPGEKRVIVVISDGLDRGSKTSFEKILAELQRQDITVYAVQAQDRTRGAIRRDVPKPRQVIDKLVEGTGGAIFSIDEPAVAAKAICDELRRNRYVLSYLPSNAPFGEVRNLLIVGDEGITVRAKTMQQPN